MKVGAWMAVMVMVGAASCKNLDEKIVSGITESYYTTGNEGFDAGVNAAYAEARNFYGTENGLTVTVFGTDIWTQGSDGGNKDFNQYSAGLNAQNGVFKSIWQNFYRGINTINVVVDHADKVKVDENLKRERLGEVRFLRALYYFDLVRMFGPIPLHIHETTEITTDVIRAPISDIYTQTIADLNYADSVLPVTASDWGRATKGAAEDLLAKVYLTRGYFTKDDADFQKAADLSEKVINSGTYKLLDNYADIFNQENQENSEVIWSVQYTKNVLLNGNGNSDHMYFLMKYDQLPGMMRAIEYGRPYTRFKPTSFLLNLYDQKSDSRYNGSFQTVWYCNNPKNIPKDGNGSPKFMVGDTAIWMPGREVSDAFRNSKPYLILSPSNYTYQFYPSLSKFLDPERPTVNETAGSRDFIVLRLGATYLVAAEAEFQLGHLDNAAKYINLLRARAAVAGHESDMQVEPGDITLDFILDERARELAGEGKRWFDLTRTGQLVSRVTTYNPEGGPNIKPYFSLRPIPTSEIDAASDSLAQNAGY